MSIIVLGVLEWAQERGVSSQAPSSDRQQGTEGEYSVLGVWQQQRSRLPCNLLGMGKKRILWS